MLYFYDRTTNGKMEGINNKIKVIKRQAYGFTNFEHLKMRIFLIRLTRLKLKLNNKLRKRNRLILIAKNL